MLTSTSLNVVQPRSARELREGELLWIKEMRVGLAWVACRPACRWAPASSAVRRGRAGRRGEWWRWVRGELGVRCPRLDWLPFA